MRKVRTASGATAVQIVSKSGGVRRIVEHLGSARTEAGLEAAACAGDVTRTWRRVGVRSARSYLTRDTLVGFR